MTETEIKTDGKMLEALVCPLTGGQLTFCAKKNELLSKSAKLAYPIRNGIPVLLESEARRFS